MLKELRDNIRKTAFLLVALLTVLLVYISYIQVVQSEFLTAHPLNRRSVEAAEKVERGQILERNGDRMAYSEPDGEGHFRRLYPYGAIASHVTGYSSLRYGKAGIESTFNGYLSGITNPERRFGPVTHLWTPTAGNDVTLTIDGALQEAAYRALGNRRGAVVALDPRTGAVLALVSKPGFDPAAIDPNWGTISAAETSPLLNRAVQGLYPPGSTLKVMIAEAVLNEKIVDTKKIFICEGTLKVGPDYTLRESNDRVDGKVDLEEALAVSCNITFGKLGLELGRSKMAHTFDRYGFSRPVGDELQEAASRLPDFSRLGDGDLAQTAIGQGSLLVTPLRMAMLAAAIANKGIIMKPYLVSKVTAPDGAVIKQYSPAEFLTVSNATLAGTVSKMMVTVVDEGTGTGARIGGVQVAGKTGTAENPHGNPHAWFIGFAPADKPQIVVAVIAENAGSGGEVAAPIARQVIARALR